MGDEKWRSDVGSLTHLAHRVEQDPAYHLTLCVCVCVCTRLQSSQCSASAPDGEANGIKLDQREVGPLMRGRCGPQGSSPSPCVNTNMERCPSLESSAAAPVNVTTGRCPSHIKRDPSRDAEERRTSSHAREDPALYTRECPALYARERPALDTRERPVRERPALDTGERPVRERPALDTRERPVRERPSPLHEGALRPLGLTCTPGRARPLSCHMVWEGKSPSR